jgi:hypothetical protein
MGKSFMQSYCLADGGQSAARHPPEVIQKILDCLGLPSRPMSMVPAMLDMDESYFLSKAEHSSALPASA